MIGTLLAGAGIKLFDKLIDNHGEDLVSKGIEKVTGIKLEGKTKLSPQEVQLINESELRIKELDFKKLSKILEDVADSRKHNISIQVAKDWLVRNTGSILAIFTILSAFVLDVVILYMVFKGLNVDPIITLIAGANNIKAGQVLSFYFGSSKTEADERRGV